MLLENFNYLSVKEFQKIKLLLIFAKGTKNQVQNKGKSYFFYLIWVIFLFFFNST